jgi:hypothetical protein
MNWIGWWTYGETNVYEGLKEGEGVCLLPTEDDYLKMILIWHQNTKKLISYPSSNYQLILTPQ